MEKSKAELAERERLIETAHYQNSLEQLQQERKHRDFMN
jgi:hypothetical protein